MTHSFIDRPIFATVLSVFVTLIGLAGVLPCSSSGQLRELGRDRPR